jgi:F0F1-type ATP synthase assembly protein I
MAPYLDLGWRLAGAAAFPPILGYFLVDLWLGTTPWGLLAGAALGLAAAFLQLKRLQEEFGP